MSASDRSSLPGTCIPRMPIRLYTTGSVAVPLVTISRSTSGRIFVSPWGAWRRSLFFPLHTRSHSQCSASVHAESATSPVRLHLAGGSAESVERASPPSSASALIGKPCQEQECDRHRRSTPDALAGFPASRIALVVRWDHALPASATHRFVSSTESRRPGVGSAVAARPAARAPSPCRVRGRDAPGSRFAAVPVGLVRSPSVIFLSQTMSRDVVEGRPKPVPRPGDPTPADASLVCCRDQAGSGSPAGRRVDPPSGRVRWTHSVRRIPCELPSIPSRTRLAAP